MKQLFNCILFLSLALTTLSARTVSVSKEADLVIFSFDRPLQFYALMESLEKYVTGIGSVSVIYRVSSQEISDAYDVCFERFKKYSPRPFKQSDRPNEDFKPLTMSLLARLKSEYLLFAVDDMLVKDYINLSECITYMDAYDAYGFYLRLGKNISYCYSARMESPTPTVMQLTQDVISWKFSDGVGDYSEWRYLNSVDMVLYRRASVIESLVWLPFGSPNTLEMYWANAGLRCADFAHKRGLCYNESKVINIPLNLVERDWALSNNMGYGIEQPLRLFQQGFRLNIAHYFKIPNNAPHAEVTPHLYQLI